MSKETFIVYEDTKYALNNYIHMSSPDEITMKTSTGAYISISGKQTEKYVVPAKILFDDVETLDVYISKGSLVLLTNKSISFQNEFEKEKVGQYIQKYSSEYNLPFLDEIKWMNSSVVTYCTYKKNLLSPTIMLIYDDKTHYIYMNKFLKLSDDEVQVKLPNDQLIKLCSSKRDEYTIEVVLHFVGKNGAHIEPFLERVCYAVQQGGYHRTNRKHTDRRTIYVKDKREYVKVKNKETNKFDYQCIKPTLRSRTKSTKCSKA